LAAAEAGAIAIGFNFWSRSPRYISPQDASRIASNLPAGIVKVGVFVNEAPETIRGVAESVRLDVIQLHGDETIADTPQYSRVWKAFRIGPDFSGAQLDAFPAEAYLLDGPAGHLYGGSGKVFEWSAAAGIRRRIILAGGLDASNVRQAIDLAQPWGVDACSRLESAPGRKDHARMRAFIKAAQS
jgi:phosphoribosylanthranilate isomerase